MGLGTTWASQILEQKYTHPTRNRISNAEEREVVTPARRKFYETVFNDEPVVKWAGNIKVSIRIMATERVLPKATKWPKETAVLNCYVERLNFTHISKFQRHE